MNLISVQHTFSKWLLDFNTCKLFLQVCSKFQSSLIASYHATYHLLWKNILTLGSQHIWRISSHTNIFSYLFKIVLLLGSQTENKQILKLNPLTRFNDSQFKGWSLLGHKDSLYLSTPVPYLYTLSQPRTTLLSIHTRDSNQT